ncbi:MAG: gas vesicle protein [Armatimonadetes bacterium]|nr:gas vesicle protein [Armatimonadota bacterium]
MAKRSADTKISLGELVEIARKELAKLTNLKAQSTVGTFKDEKGWHVLVDMLEKESIPNSMDILATYEVILDEEGELMEFNRKKMRKRIDVINEEE